MTLHQFFFDPEHNAFGLWLVYTVAILGFFVGLAFLLPPPNPAERAEKMIARCEADGLPRQTCVEAVTFRLHGW